MTKFDPEVLRQLWESRKLYRGDNPWNKKYLHIVLRDGENIHSFYSSDLYDPQCEDADLIAYAGTHMESILSYMSPSRGELINKEAYIGARIVELHTRIPEIEKQSRKTPPKTLLAEVAKVKQAKENLERSMRQLEALEAELKEVKEQLEKMK